MSDLYVAIGLPVLTIMIALVVNLIHISDVRAVIREIRSDVKALTDEITSS